MLVYAMIAHRMTTLVEYLSHGYDDAKSAAMHLQGRATYAKQAEGIFMSERKGPFICECMIGGSYIFIVVGTTSTKEQEIRDCLLDIRSTVSDVLYQVKKPVANMLSTRLTPILQEKVEQYNVTREVATDQGIVKIKNELAEVNDIMRSNIHKVLDRGEKLEELEESTTDLVASSAMFQMKARKLRRQMFWEKWCKYLVMFVVLAVVGLFIYLMIALKERNSS